MRHPQRAERGIVRGMVLAAAAWSLAACGSMAQTNATPVATNLAAIFGDAVAEWQVMSRGKPVDPPTSPVDGHEALVVDKSGLTIVHTNPCQAGTDIDVVCRLAPPERGSRSLGLEFAVTNVLAANNGIHLSFSSSAGREDLGWGFWDPWLPPVAGRAVRIGGSYVPQGISGRSLTWPESLRRIIERDMALKTPLHGKWLHIRVTLLPDGFRAWLNGRLLSERRGPGFDVSGAVRLHGGEGLELRRVTLAAAEPDDPRFDPVALEHYLNASALNGRDVERSSLPAPDRLAAIGGIPFRFPAADARGNNHVDLGPSWLQTGFLEGGFDASGGGVGGRWIGALSENPTRLQFRIRNGRFKAVHVIAAADDDRDEVPIITAQFYRPLCGFPRQFSARAPLFSAEASDVQSVPVRLANGREGRAYRVTIPVEPGALAEFEELDHLEMELTKEVKLYRAYPDPMYYSYHPAGLPSSVHVFALTLERPAVSMRVTPRAFADAWAAPDKPAYDVALRNATDQARRVAVTFKTVSHDGRQVTTETRDIDVPGRGEAAAAFLPALAAHGHHDVSVTLRDGADVWTEKRGLAYLHPDTRERGDWQEGRGPIFGFWNWRGGHRTPSGAEQVGLMGLAGAESCSGSFESENISEEERAAARRWKLITFKAFGAGDHYITAGFRGDLAKDGPETARTNFLGRLAKAKTAATDINRPEICSFFPEPHIGPITYGTLPEYYGDPEPRLSEAETANYQSYHDAFVQGARILKGEYPGVKCLLPHGDPLFPAIFLRRSADVRSLVDGTTVDIPVFERLPEQQIHQVSLHRMYMAVSEWRKAGIAKPLLPMYEGPCLSSADGSLSEQELADQSLRCSLILLAYGVERQCGGWCPFDSGSYWGEQHYGGGICHRLPRATPKPAFSVFATMTRHLNRRNLTRWIPTGSLSVYGLEFAHYRTGEKMHVFWTLRGRRPVSVPVSGSGTVKVVDSMDNAAEAAVVDGKATFTVSTSPCWVYGLTGDEGVALGQPDHGDAAPGPNARQVAHLGDGSWALSTVPDPDYAESQPEFIRRFPGRMGISVVDAPAASGGKALAVHLDEKQERDQKTMPYYTTLVPRRPVRIPGRGSHLGLWVNAASDWGRVIYSVRDARGERWISIGTKGAWNADDTFNWSAFCFDGWRYLRFELPANSPYDTFREAGSTWWGSYGKGDGIVDLPLTLEKIIVERRPYALYVNDPQPTARDDVLLAGLMVEYAQPGDATEEAVRLARLRMPVPKGVPDLGNPVQKLAAEGTGAPTKVLKVVPPDHQADGTQCHVHFVPVAGATGYDVWVSPYPDGRGALALGNKWTESGKLIRGLRPDIDFYVFVVYTDKDGKASKPSPPLKIRLKDMFGMK